MGFSEDLLAGKNVLITGAGKGIGKACALLASACGANVIAVARTESDLISLQQHNPEHIEIWRYDVADPEFHQKIRDLPKLDGLINNAGTNRVAAMQEQTTDNIDAVIDLNIRALYLVAQAALPPMMRNQSGSIVNMSSQMAFVGSPGRTLYCMSKHAVEGLTKAMAVELATSGIRVNSVAPTFVRTPMTEPMLADPKFKEFVFDMLPMQQLATPEDVANACIFLLSELSKLTTGSCAKVDGGWTAR